MTNCAEFNSSKPKDLPFHFAPRYLSHFSFHSRDGFTSDTHSTRSSHVSLKEAVCALATLQHYFSAIINTLED